MKHRLQRLLKFLLLLIPFNQLSSQTTATIDRINYLLYSDGTAAVGKNRTFVGDCVIPSNVTYSGKSYTVIAISDYAFFDCKGLSSAIIPNSVTTIGEWAFSDCENLTSINIPNGVTSIDECVFGDCKNLASIEIPNSVTTIGDCAFINCKSLTSIEIPTSVSSIGGGSFNGCSKLTSISIPTSVSSIGGSAFFMCTELHSISIPNSVTAIQNETFMYCINLKSVTIGSSTASIGTKAFFQCLRLTDITSLNKIPPIIENNDAFDNDQYQNATLHVPTDGLDNYKYADAWKDFKNIDSDISGVEEVTVNEANAPAEYYRLDGAKAGCSTEGLTPGIYIKRQGSKTEKVAIH